MIEAILYTSNTGSTRHYAEMLGEKTGLPVYSLDKSPVQAGAEIIYLGWVMASGIKGYAKAAKKYNVKAVCGVCMGVTGTQLPEMRKANAVPEETPVFSLQGGFNLKKLHGIYRIMMNMISKGIIKGLSEKTDRTPDDDDTLDMMLHGGDRVSEENLTALFTWYEELNQ